jgi:hypothetical protein
MALSAIRPAISVQNSLTILFIRWSDGKAGEIFFDNKSGKTTPGTFIFIGHREGGKDIGAISIGNKGLLPHSKMCSLSAALCFLSSVMVIGNRKVCRKITATRFKNKKQWDTNKSRSHRLTFSTSHLL